MKVMKYRSLDGHSTAEIAVAHAKRNEKVAFIRNGIYLTCQGVDMTDLFIHLSCLHPAFLVVPIVLAYAWGFWTLDTEQEI